MNHKRTKLAILFLSLLLVSSLLSACSSSQDTSEENTAAEESDTSNAGSDDTADTDSAGSDSADAADTESSEASDTETIYNTGSFTMEDINGETYTEAMFQDYDLTLVNVFATWCPPCIAELPYLEQLSQDMAESGVNVVGIVLDTIDVEGRVDTDALESAKTLAEELETTYPFLIPDADMMNGLLYSIQSFPTTFFVDSEGNLAGHVYVGSRSLEDWTDIVDEELSALEAAE